MNIVSTGFLSDVKHSYRKLYLILTEEDVARKESLLKRFGKLPAGMSDADVQVVLQFLYGAFDKQTAKQVTIFHPYWDDAESNEALPEMTVSEFCRWLQAQAA